MSEIVFPSTKAGNEVDRAVTAALSTIPGQITQIDTRVTALEEDVDDLSGLPAQVTQIGLKIGNLTQLETDEKSNLVGAINEVKSSAGGIYNLIENNHSSAMSLATALQHIPTDKYSVGLHIIFNESNVGVVEYQFTDANVSNITNASYWEAIPHTSSPDESVVTSENSVFDTDLEIADERGKVLVEFSNGHIKTKNFDSANTMNTGNAVEDFVISDDNGNAIVVFKGGHIKTKNFDSSKVENWLRGKNVAIMGDSISTNGHYTSTNEFGNVPEIVIGTEDVGVQLSAYLTYYDVNTTHLSLGGHTYASSEIGNEVTFTPAAADVGKIIGMPKTYNEATSVVWWETAADVLGFTPIPVCWSGSDVTSHRGDTADHKCSYAWHESQIRKCGIRTKGTMTRTAPDAIIIYRGTNDFSHEPYTTLTDGYFDGASWTYPNTDNLGSTYGFKEGMVLTIKKLREAYPDAYIILCTLNVFKRVNYSAFPTNNGINSLPEYNNAIREIADFMGCGLIEFDKDGITFENCYPTYISDSETTPTHPNDYGHLVMAKKAITDLLNIKQK